MKNLFKKLLITTALTLSVIASAQLTITQGGNGVPISGGPQIWSGEWSSNGVSHTVTGSTYRQCRANMIAQTRYLTPGYYLVVRQCSL